MVIATVLVLLSGNPAAAAAASAARAPDLGLSRGAQDAVVRFAADLQSARRQPNDQRLCALIGEARQVGFAVARSLDQRRDTIGRLDLDSVMDLGLGTSSAATPAPGDSQKQKDAFDASLRDLVSAVPGLFSRDGDAIRFGLDYGSLSGAARSAPDRALLASTSTLVKGNSALTFRAPADTTRCADLGRTLDQVKEIRKSWRDAQACVKTELADQVDAALGSVAIARFGESACFCGPADKAQLIGKDLATVLEALPDVGGLRNADTLRKTLADPTTKFDCH